MTIYAGQRLRIDAQITDYDGATLRPPDLTSAIVSIKDYMGTMLVTGVAMTWDGTFVNEDGTLGAYHYFWNSPSNAGSYECEIIASGPNVSTNNFKTIRLRRNRF